MRTFISKIWTHSIKKEEIRKFSERVLEETRRLKNPLSLDKFPEIVILDYNALAQLIDEAFLANFNSSAARF